MTKHAVVVGAGVIGLCAAESLIRRGFRVTVVEQEAKPGEGCSYGNGGIIVPSHFVPLAAPGMVGLGLRMMLNRQSPFGVERLTDPFLLGWMARFARCSTKANVERAAPLLRDLNLASRSLYESLLSEMDAKVGYDRRGLLMLSKTHAAHEAEAHLAAEARRLGLSAKVLDAKGVKEIEPDVDLAIAGAVHFEDDAHLSPPAFMDALRQRLTKLGATILDGKTISGFEVRQNRLVAVRAGGENLEADEFVLAAGSWSGRLASSLGLRIPLVAGRGYGFTVADPPQRPRTPMILTEARVAVTPLPEGVRFVGTMELAQPATRAGSPRVEGMRRSIPEYLPSFQNRLDAPVWCGLRPCSPDGLPYLGRTGRFDNLIVATGHAMMGMSLGPITGQIVAQLASREETSLPIQLLSPDRYA